MTPTSPAFVNQLIERAAKKTGKPLIVLHVDDKDIVHEEQKWTFVRNKVNEAYGLPMEKVEHVTLIDNIRSI